MKKLIKTPKTVEKVVEVVTEEVTSVVEQEGGPVTKLGKTVFVLCSTYAYTGVLVGVNDKFIEIQNPRIVYETGDWKAKAWKDAQELPTDVATIFFSQIESFFEVTIEKK